MARWQELADDLNHTGFARDFIASYLERGFGTLTKREVDLLVINLLVKYRKAWSDHKPGDYEIARVLSISPRKVRSMLDELAYRDPEKTEEWCDEQLLAILRDAEKHVAEGFVRVQIDDGLVRAHATAKIRHAMGLVDTSFNSAIIKLSGERYAALVLELVDETEADTILKELPEDVNAQAAAPDSPSRIRLFIDAFAQGAGRETGAQLVRLGFALLTGGLPDAIDIARSFLGRRRRNDDADSVTVAT